MKTRDLIKMIEADGWYLDRVKGSHHLFKHPTKAGTLCVPVHSLGKDVAIGIEKAILRQAGLR
jgi:predicted RNA binding protein YcfA (HicA-like mRNA interferase family)